MILVVWVHCCYNVPHDTQLDFMRNYIQTMYMPCFFILSGLFAKDVPIRDFIRKKWKSLLKPLFFTYFMSIAIIWIVLKIFPIHIKGELNVFSLFLSQAFPNGPIWFLAALFVALFVVLIISKIKNLYLQLFSLIIVFCVGYYGEYLFPCRLPFFADSGLTATLFIFVGKSTMQFSNRIPDKRLVNILLGVACFVVSFPFDCHYSMLTNTYDGQIVSFLLRSVSASYSVILLSKAISHSTILEFIGRNSLIVLCFHMFVIMAFGAIAKNISCNYWLVPLCCLVTILSMFLIVPFIRKTLFFVFK